MLSTGLSAAWELWPSKQFVPLQGSSRTESPIAIVCGPPNRTPYICGRPVFCGLAMLCVRFTFPLAGFYAQDSQAVVSHVLLGRPLPTAWRLSASHATPSD